MKILKYILAIFVLGLGFMSLANPVSTAYAMGSILGGVASQPVIKSNDVISLPPIVINPPAPGSTINPPTSGGGGTVINPPTPVPITLVYPNGGEVFQAGQSMPVKWISNGYSANSLVNVDLMVHNPNGTYTNTSLMSFTGLPNTGTATFTIPTNVPSATNYAIKVLISEPTHDVNQFDYSDGDFTIKNSSTTTECNDGLDNDRDLLIDIQDPQCHTDGNPNNPNSYNPNHNSEALGPGGGGGNTQCSDGIDNDGDGAVDYPADSGCLNSQDNTELQLIQLGTCGVFQPPFLPSRSGDMTSPTTYNYVTPSSNPTPGDFADHSWIQVVNTAPTQVLWDMGIATDSVYLVPSITSPGYAHEATLYGFTTPTGPTVLATEVATYTDGPSNWISDNDTALWKFSMPVRYIFAVVGGIQNDGDAQIDALCLGPAANNNAPIADAGPDQTITLPTNSTTLDGSSSYDPDGSTLTYTWTFVSGPSNIDPADVVSPSVSGLVLGTYEFRLTVRDNDGLTGTDTVNILVKKRRSGGGGGSGGHSSGGGRVLGASDVCNLNVNTYMRRNYNNNRGEVQALQAFLNQEMNLKLVVDGNFGLGTEYAVKAFQLKYRDDTLAPWENKYGLKGYMAPTGIVYKTTLTKIKNIECKNLKLPIPSSAELTPWIVNYFASLGKKAPAKATPKTSNPSTGGVRIQYNYYYNL